MDIKRLEQDVFEILKRDYMKSEYDNESNGRNYCLIPPGIILEILSTLVIPIVTALITEFLTQKLLSDHNSHSTEIERAQCLHNYAEREIESRSAEMEIPPGQESGSISQHVSANLMLHIDIQSPDDVKNLISYLEQYLHEDIARQNMQE